MADAAVAGEQRLAVGGAVLARRAQGRQRGLGDLLEIGLAAFAEDDAQVRGQPAHHAQQRALEFTQGFGIVRVRQLAHRHAGGFEPAVAVPGFAQVLHARGVGLALDEAALDADAALLAQAAAVGQQQADQLAPLRQGVGAGVRPGLDVGGPGEQFVLLRGLVCDQHQFGTGGVAEQVLQLVQAVLDHQMQQFAFGGFPGFVAGAQQTRQPLLAARQHVRQTRQQAVDTVVGEAQESLQGIAVLGGEFAVFEFREQARHRLGVQRPGIVGDAHRPAEPGTQGELRRELRIEAVDRGGAQARRRLQQMPAARLIMRQQARRGGVRFGVVGIVRCRAIERRAQGLQHAVADLGGGLVGEGDRDHLLGFLDRRQRTQHALHQQAGLAGAGRRHRQDVMRKVQRLGARGGVGQGAHSASSRSRPASVSRSA